MKNRSILTTLVAAAALLVSGTALAATEMT